MFSNAIRAGSWNVRYSVRDFIRTRENNCAHRMTHVFLHVELREDAPHFFLGFGIMGISVSAEA